MKRKDILSKLREWLIPATLVGAIIAFAYLVSPDLLVGPLDDALVAFIVTRVEKKMRRK